MSTPPPAADLTAGQAAVPADKVQLTLLLVSGKRQSFLFDPKDTIERVKAHIAANWPKEWADETPTSAASLKIVHLGRFLADNTTLEESKIPAGASTIVHLTIKNPTPGGTEEPTKRGNSENATCKICVIL